MAETLDFFTRLSSPIVRDDWKKSLNALFTLLRKKFVFDNLAIYLVEAKAALQKLFMPVLQAGDVTRKRKLPGERKLPTR